MKTVELRRCLDYCIFRPVYAGNALSTVKYTGSGPCFMTIRPTAFPAGQASAGTPAPIATLDTGTIKSGTSVIQRIIRSKIKSCRYDLAMQWERMGFLGFICYPLFA